MASTPKIKVAILFVGQIRTNSLSNNNTNTTDILNSYNEYLFTNEWKEQIDHDIFISTDSLDLDRTIQYFGDEKIKNIHLMERPSWMRKIINQIPDENYFMDIYNNTNDFQGFSSYPQNVHQFYKWYDACNLHKQHRI